MRWMLLLVAIAGCGFHADAIDAGMERDSAVTDAYQCHHVQLDAAGWGDPCSAEQTALCRDDLGWCIDGVCRPQCIQPLACLACEGTREHFSQAGLCYCAP